VTVKKVLKHQFVDGRKYMGQFKMGTITGKNIIKLFSLSRSHLEKNWCVFPWQVTSSKSSIGILRLEPSSGIHFEMFKSVLPQVLGKA
jgi:hypothetical protein